MDKLVCIILMCIFVISFEVPIRMNFISNGFFSLTKEKNFVIQFVWNLFLIRLVCV